MIEVIYKEEKQEAQGEEMLFTVPRNIRQIGLIRDDYKIYIEDYVYTFLVRLADSGEEKEGSKGKIAVLTGETRWWSGAVYLFIKGAVMVENMEAAADHIDFTEEIWADIHEEQEKYFQGQEIVGWFFAQSQLPLEVTEMFAKVHLKNFGGEKALMLMEPQEKEEAFFLYENSFMVRQSGYYIYYEKNPQMQTYMIEKSKELQFALTEEAQDKAVKDFRKIIKRKKEQETEESASVFSYAATACLAIAVLVVGVNFYRSYEQINETSSEIRETSSVLVEEEPDTESSVTPAVREKVTTAAAPEVTSEAETVITPSAAPAVTRTVTPAAKVKAVPTAALKKEEDSQEEKTESDEAAQTLAENDIYKEEADIRKAKRREATGTYVIKPGDTLFQISMDKYGSVEEIQEICTLNGLKPEEIIYPGQVIVLP